MSLTHFVKAYIVFKTIVGNPNGPVASFEKYIQKLNPECESLRQRPKHYQHHMILITMIFNTPIWWQARIIFGNLCRLSAKRQNLQRTLIILLKLHESQSWMSQDMNLGI